MSGLNFFHYIIAAGTIIGFIRIGKLPSLLKTIPFFLGLTFFVEAATPLKLIKFHGSNHWLFNIFTSLEFLYYSFIFYHIFDSHDKKKIVLIVSPLFFLFVGINIFLIQGVNRFHTISYRVGAVMIVLWCYFYFRQLMQSSGYINPLRSPLFWISTGLFFFYLGYFFYFSAFDYIVYKKIEFNLKLWVVISDALNAFLYICFIIAVLCPKKKAK